MPTYFLFTLNAHTVALEAAFVEEVLALPELMLIPDAPAGIVGVFNRRGQIVPVLDLPLGDGPRAYQVTDSLLLLRSENTTVGLIVSAVQGVQEIAATTIQPPQGTSSSAPPLLAGMAGEPSILVLNPPPAWLEITKLQQVSAITSFLLDHDPADLGDASFSTAFLPDAQAILWQRAEELRAPQDSVAAGRTLTVVAIGSQLLGIDTQHVREFVTVQQATPVPCCPPHIVGSMGLRGEIVTILDAGAPLGLPPKAIAPKPKAVVLEAGAAPVAMLVDEVCDAMFIASPEQDAPAASSGAIQSAYITEVVSYQQRPLHVLDLSALLSSADVVVDERL